MCWTYWCHLRPHWLRRSVQLLLLRHGMRVRLLLLKRRCLDRLACGRTLLISLLHDARSAYERAGMHIINALSIELES